MRYAYDVYVRIEFNLSDLSRSVIQASNGVISKRQLSSFLKHLTNKQQRALSISNGNLCIVPAQILKREGKNTNDVPMKRSYYVIDFLTRQRMPLIHPR